MRKRIFVSFSSKNREFISLLLDRLDAQELQVWDYSMEGEEIPGGPASRTT